MTHHFQKFAIAIVGNAGALNVGESLRRAAQALGHQVQFFDSYRAAAGPRLLRSLSWHLGGRRPLRLGKVSAEIAEALAKTRPQFLIATGAAPLTETSLHTLRRWGVLCMNFSTDDPWNSTQRASWYLRALPAYDLVFTPRHANILEFKAIGCQHVRCLPFGYDELLVAARNEPIDVPSCDALFVGGADRDRAKFMKAYMHAGGPITLCGDYWGHYPSLRPHSLGHRRYEEVRQLTTAAKVNLCLVRRANRDGHVMRSFEIAAIGGCMLAQDTEDHRAFFGRDGGAVLFFRTPEEAAELARRLIADPLERARMAASLHKRIMSGRHSYRDRLETMLEAATAQLEREKWRDLVSG